MNKEIDIAAVDLIVREAGTDSKHTLKILQALQGHFNYLPLEALKRVCETTSITPAHIDGVASFYQQFRMKPAGKYFIKVCVGTACHVKGADKIYDAFRGKLGIKDDDDTDKDGLFTVEKVACLGCCMLAPAVQIGDVTYGFVTPQKAAGVLRDFLESRETSDDDAGELETAGATSGEIRICLCASCTAGGSGAVYDEFKRTIAALGLKVRLKTVGCTGFSYLAPLIEIKTGLSHIFRYGRFRKENVRQVLDRHFKTASPLGRFRANVRSLLERLLTGEDDEAVTRFSVDTRDGLDRDYCRTQKNITTEHAGEADPLDIEEYVRTGGFQALRKVIKSDPAEVVSLIEKSGLRGRGGAGYPTGRKWRSVMESLQKVRFVICNGDEGDPGAFMDRMIMESFPFRVIEGLVIAALATGAEEAFLYIRSEYPLAIRRIQKALELCGKAGYVGANICGGEKRVDVSIVAGAGAFVCGEETALIAAIEGKRGMPGFRPPYPSENGLYGKPTLVNNVETLAAVPWIIRNGVESFSAIGTQNSKGTKTFALAGRINRGGLVEVPMGMTLKDIVERTGGGIQGNNTFKAVQAGGPSGGCVPASEGKLQVDYESLSSAGAMMGSGGMVVLDNTDCMVDISRYFLAFTQNESCGKCTFCRIGTKRMLEILVRICDGEGKEGDIELLESLADRVRKGSLCGLGKTAPNPVLSAIRYFREEFDAHIKGICPAGKCKNLIEYKVNDDCIGCTRCAQHCPVKAIEMNPYQKHIIDAAKCTRCDTCRQVCPSGAIDICSGNKVVRAGHG